MHILKGILYYGAILLVFVIVTPYVWSFFSRLTKGQMVEVQLATPIEGKVSKCDVNNHNFLWYLNDEEVRYDFGPFKGADAFTRAEQAKLPAQNGTGLRYYLEVGDVIQKEANSYSLMVKRGATITNWTCATDKTDTAISSKLQQ